MELATCRLFLRLAVFVDVFCPFVPACFIPSEESKNLSLRALLTNRETSAISPRDDDLDPSLELSVDRLPVGVVRLYRDNSISMEIYGSIFARVHVRGEIGVVAVVSPLLLLGRLTLPSGASLVNERPETACVGPISSWSQGLVPVRTCGERFSSDASGVSLRGLGML